MAKISVIIPCYNAANWIAEALQSVVRQGLADLEVIVVDDGSTDESVKIAEKDFPFARLIKTENQGASKARNLGTRASTGEFIQYLDSDDLLLPQKFHNQTIHQIIRNGQY